MGHAQATTAPGDAQVQKIVDFELGLTTAQIYDFSAGSLNDDDAIGGPRILANLQSWVFGVKRRKARNLIVRREQSASDAPLSNSPKVVSINKYKRRMRRLEIVLVLYALNHSTTPHRSKCDVNF